MKKKLKENCLIILIFFIVACVIYSAVNDFNVNMKKNKFRQEQMISECQNNINSSTDEKYIKYCNQLLEKKQELKIDFFSMLSDILVFKLRFLNATSFILLIVPTLINVCKILKNKYIYNFSTRGNYKEFIKMFLKLSYKYIWLLPTFAIILLLCCSFSSTFNIEFALKYNSSIWSMKTMENPILFIVGYILNITLYSFSFINISLIVARKHHNIIAAVIVSILSYIGIQLFLEVVVNALICQKLLHKSIGHLFNIMNLYTYSDQFGILALLVFSILVFVVTCLGVIFSYKNKEKLIIDCEKNN